MSYGNVKQILKFCYLTELKLEDERSTYSYFDKLHNKVIKGST